jgi:transposase
VLFEDETDLLLFPPLEATWGKRGQPIPVPLSGWNARQVFFGTLDVHTGHRLVAVYDRQRAEEFCDFLEILRWHYRAWGLLLVLDAHPAHTAEMALALAQDLEIELVFLPKRSPHLNGMDHVFRRGKQEVSANRQYPDIDAHAWAFMAWVVSLTPNQVLTKAGILSEDFWLRDCLHQR